MPYVLSGSLVLLGLVLLMLTLVSATRALLRLRRAHKLVLDDLADRGGMLKARFAGVRVGIAQRRDGWSQRTY